MKKLSLIAGISFAISLGVFFAINAFISNAPKTYEEIITENKGPYLVKNAVYTGTSMDISDLEKTVKAIRSTCPRQCKVNLYSDRKAFELDMMSMEANFEGYTPEQKSYIATHDLAYWGIEKGDVIEYYPEK